MSLVRRLCLAGSLAALALPAFAEPPIQPGYWESKNHSELLITQDSTSRKCITPSQVESYLAGPANNHYSCIYDHRAIGDGEIKLSGQCTDNNGLKMDVAIAGTYSREHFDLKAQLHTKFAGLPIVGSASIDARRLGECPAPDAPQPGVPSGR